jgi:3-oxoacyl-[acyl-carrier protein] reductase
LPGTAPRHPRHLPAARCDSRSAGHIDAREVFSGFAERAGTTVEAMLAERARTGTLLKRFPTLAEVANIAAFVASDRASAMTGAIANLTCGSLVD